VNIRINGNTSDITYRFVNTSGLSYTVSGQAGKKQKEKYN
jgi:hypothetical protein